jgi:PAS domain S-box-containing protein
MKRLFAIIPSDLPALHQRREHALKLILGIMLLMPLPVIALDLLRILPQKAYGLVGVEILIYLASLPLLLNRRIPYQWRTLALISAMLLFSSYPLLSAGMISAGRIYVVASIVIAALMLSRRAMLVAWLGGAAVLTLGGIAFADRSFVEVAAVTQRLTDPNTLLTNGMITLWVSAAVAVGASSLVSSLASSLRATEQALAERDQTNAELEQRVAERTSALESQLAVQAAVARCSQILLRPVATIAEQQQLLSDALAAVVSLLASGHIVVLENFSDPEDGACVRMSIGASTEHGPFIPRHPASRKVPWRAAPASMRRALEAGEPWGGEAAVVLADAPQLLASTNAYGISLIQIYPIAVEGAWWGGLVFTDTARAHGWSQAELLLHQMAAELIGTAIQRWQTEASLGLQLRYAEALARCSQLLLQPAAGDAERQAVLGAALTALREAVSVSRLYIFQPPTNPLGEAGLRLLADAQASGFKAYIEPSPEEVMDAPRPMVDGLKAGRWFGGPVPGRFPQNPRFQQSLDQNGVQAILMVPIMLGGGLWGVLSAIDRVQLRDWDTPTLQMLRTAAEMIATFQQGWEAAAVLRAREHFIQRVTEMSPDIVHVLDLATQRSLFLNRSLDAWLDHPAEAITEIRPELMQQLIHPDDTARVLAHYADLRAAADGQVAEQEFRVRTHDGRERWIVSRDLVFARDEHGQPSQILSIVQDITAGKRTEQALAASEARLRALRDALPDLLFIVRADGTFLEFYPPRQADMLVPPETFLGRTIAEVLPPAAAAMAERAIAQVHASGGLELFEDAITFGPRNLLFEIRVAPIIADELLFVVRDITERRQATSELLRAKDAAEAADRAKSTFLAHISHEIRTPLTAIIGMASLLRDTSLSPQQDEFVRTIRTGAETLLSIIGTILDFSKIEAGQMALTVLPFDLRACLSEARALVVHQAHSKGLALEYAVAPAVPPALAGDGGRLRQVLVNLLINAVKFTERGAVMLLASGRPLAEDGYELTIRISDTGIGIAAEHLPDIFDPFVQVDSTPTRRYGGTGLGLAISKQLVTLMGGQITVASTPSAGSTFTLTLPLRIAATPPAALAPTRAPGEPTAQRPLRVLLAEDNLINQEVLRRLIEHLGHLPDVVANGAAALEAVCRQPYDVVLMDIQMPELDGEEATRRIRALAGIRQPTIIALTASALRGDRERYLAGGMDDYLSKPVQVDDLRAALDRAGIDLAPAPARPDPGPAQPLAQGPAPDLVDWALVDRMLAAIGGAPGQSLDLMQELFATTLAAQMTEIAAAIAAADRALVRLLAHKLRGGSQQLGAARLAACWAALEAAALADGGPLAEPLDQARHVYDATLALIRARQGALPPPASDG